MKKAFGLIEILFSLLLISIVSSYAVYKYTNEETISDLSLLNDAQLAMNEQLKLYQNMECYVSFNYNDINIGQNGEYEDIYGNKFNYALSAGNKLSLKSIECEDKKPGFVLNVFNDKSEYEIQFNSCIEKTLRKVNSNNKGTYVNNYSEKNYCSTNIISNNTVVPTIPTTPAAIDNVCTDMPFVPSGLSIADLESMFSETPSNLTQGLMNYINSEITKQNATSSIDIENVMIQVDLFCNTPINNVCTDIRPVPSGLILSDFQTLGVTGLDSFSESLINYINKMILDKKIITVAGIQTEVNRITTECITSPTSPTTQTSPTTPTTPTSPTTPTTPTSPTTPTTPTSPTTPVVFEPVTGLYNLSLPSYIYPKYYPSVECSNTALNNVHLQNSGFFAGNTNNIIEGGSGNVEYKYISSLSTFNFAATYDFTTLKSALVMEIEAKPRANNFIFSTDKPLVLNIDNHMRAGSLNLSYQYNLINFNGNFAGDIVPDINNGYVCFAALHVNSGLFFEDTNYDHIFFIRGSIGYSLTGGNKGDIMEVAEDYFDKHVSLGNGSNVLYVKGVTNTYTLVGGEGQDQIKLNQMVNFVPASQSPITKLTDRESENLIDLGNGDNNLFIESGHLGELISGNGNDIIYVGATITKTIDLGGGNDIFHYAGTISCDLNGGLGEDILYLSKYTLADYNNDVDLIKSRLLGFEKIILKDAYLNGVVLQSDFKWNVFLQ